MSIEMTPTTYSEYKKLGDAMASESRFDDAIAAYGRAAKLGSEAPKSGLCLAMARCYAAQGALKKARACYLAVLRADRTCLPALVRLAIIHERQEDFARASTCFLRAVKMHPNHHRAQLGLANARRRAGDKDGSNTAYAKANACLMSSGVVNRTTVLQRLIDRKPDQMYLEIGVAAGHNFLQVMADKKIAVDPRFRMPGGHESCESEMYYEIRSDDFFLANNKMLNEAGLDVVLIDGLHTYEQSLKDVRNCLRYLNTDGVIVLHDCKPSSPAAAHPIRSEASKMPDWTGAWMGDVWKTIVHLRSLRDDLNVLVLDCDCGLGIITSGAPDDMLGYTQEGILALDYGDLQADESRLLNLKGPEQFDVFLRRTRR